MRLAEVYVMAGEENLAVEQLRMLLSILSSIAVPLLRVDPIWGPLRTNTDFQELLAEYEN